MRLRNDRDLIHILRREWHDEATCGRVVSRVSDRAASDARLARRCAQTEILDRCERSRHVIRACAREAKRVALLRGGHRAERASLKVVALARVLVETACAVRAAHDDERERRG